MVLLFFLMGFLIENGVLRSTVRRAQGRRRPWVAPNGQQIVLPLEVTASEYSPDIDENLWEISAIVDLVDKTPKTVSVKIEAHDGIDEALLHRTFRWASPREIVTLWCPEQLAEGRDPYAEEPGRELWLAVGSRHDLSPEFLAKVGQQAMEVGRGYAPVLAARYGTTARTVRSWVEKGRQAGVIPPAPGQGRAGSV